MEHIVLDGASEDGSTELIAGFARRGYFAHYSSEKDTGIYNAMNKAASRARGAYLMFIHSDDEVLPEGLVAMQRALAAHQPDYCLAPVRLENPADKSSASQKEKKPALWRPSVVRAPLAQVSCHQGVAVSARAFAKIGGFDERYKIAADVDQLLRLYLESYAHLVFDEPVALFRAGGMSMNSSLGAAECVDICMRRYGAEIGLSPEEIKTLIQVNPAAWIFSEHRAAVASVVHKIARAQNASLARAVYEAMLCAWFDDASGRSEAASSAGALFDTPFSRARLLPRKRGIAYLLAAVAKKLHLYPLIRPLRNAIVGRAEKRTK